MQDCVKIGMWQSYRKQAQGKFDSGAILLPQPSCSSGVKRGVERTETDSAETLRADADAFVISEELRCLFETAKSCCHLLCFYSSRCLSLQFIFFIKKKRSDKQAEMMSHQYFADTFCLLLQDLFLYFTAFMYEERGISHMHGYKSCDYWSSFFGNETRT